MGGSPHSGETWNCLISRLPEHIFSLSWETFIVLLSVIHMKRDRNYWFKNGKKRVKILSSFSPPDSWSIMAGSGCECFTLIILTSVRCGRKWFVKLFDHLTNSSDEVPWHLKKHHRTAGRAVDSSSCSLVTNITSRRNISLLFLLLFVACCAFHLPSLIAQNVFFPAQIDVCLGNQQPLADFAW